MDSWLIFHRRDVIPLEVIASDSDEETDPFRPSSVAESDNENEVGESGVNESKRSKKRRSYSHSTRRGSIARSHSSGMHHDESAIDIVQQQKNLLQVMLLEAGILFHSVFI